MSRVELKGVSKRYGDAVAVRDLSLDIREGEFLTLLGPSGCGKTTTLRMIAGFVLPTSGTVRLGDDDVTHLPPNKRGIGMVFQDYALFPHMTISENVAFGLTERKTGKEQISKRVRELLEMVQLASMENRYPPELSGGQQQRIAVARAVAYSPRVLLMDEPLGALDLKLREAMQAEIRQIQQRLGTTTVYVTHDQTEAMHMSDRIVVMNDGRIEQMGSAEEIYDRPLTRFVAGFIGQINLLDAAVVGRDGAAAVVELAGRRVKMDVAEQTDGPVTVGLRREHLELLSEQAVPTGYNSLPGQVAGRTFSGNLVHVEVALASGQNITVDVRPEIPVAAKGSPVTVVWSPQRGTILRQ